MFWKKKWSRSPEKIRETRDLVRKVPDPDVPRFYTEVYLVTEYYSDGTSVSYETEVSCCD